MELSADCRLPQCLILPSYRGLSAISFSSLTKTLSPMEIIRSALILSQIQIRDRGTAGMKEQYSPFLTPSQGKNRSSNHIRVIHVNIWLTGLEFVSYCFIYRIGLDYAVFISRAELNRKLLSYCGSRQKNGGRYQANSMRFLLQTAAGCFHKSRFTSCRKASQILLNFPAYCFPNPELDVFWP